MEEEQEMRFVSKLCDKRYPSGKSLGGHMRSHVNSASANSAELEEGFEPTNKKKLSSFDENGNGNGNGNSSYGLRENPRKTWRAVDTNFPLPQERVCKQCGKGFQSLKALCGHMACHSEKERGLKDHDHSWTSESQKLVMDSHSDTEAEDPTRLTRSKSKRYKKLNVVKQSSLSLGNNNNNNYSSSNNYGSSSVTEIDELEQEEVALCLMMLSKDSGGNWFGVNSVVESSDNNSVVLETKSSSIDMRNGRKEWNFDEKLDFKKGGMKLKGSVWDADSAYFENLNSGYYRNGIKRVESDDSIDEMLRKGEYKSKGIEIFDKQFSKGFDRDFSYEKTKFNKSLIKEKSYDSRKRVRDESYNPEVREESVKKKSKYECMNCNKIFSSFQGLGGHRPCHKKANASFASRYGSGENSLDEEIPDWKTKKSNAKDPSRDFEKKNKSKKSKAHECPICFRLFKSGQALGGHKRSHFLNGAEEKYDPMPVMETEKDLIDLNLPAPEED